MRTYEPIAIIGIGCRFPGAHGPLAFWKLLRDGVDAITTVPMHRFEKPTQDSLYPHQNGDNILEWGGFLEQVDQFDAAFFNVLPREAQYMDPQHRILLETAWEALENSGQAPAQLSGTRTGVFIGISSQNYSHIAWGTPSTKNDKASDALFIQTGTSHAIAANRISYFFDWRGPSLTFDTACSSSLVAVHQACQSLWAGESTQALAGGVTLLLLPKVTERLTKAGFLSPDGRCRSFDAEGKGFVRGEGVGLIILKPLSRAVLDGDSIYAVIRGSAMNQDGRSNGITAPNRHAQEALLKEAYRRANVSIKDISYVEAHGTGTVFGDSIEARALGMVLNQGQQKKIPCMIGSVKTNIGHLEAASGIAGFIKVALSIHHRQIPPSLHFKVPNPYIKFDAWGLRVPQTLESWPEGPGPFLAGVNSFGFGGTNVHVVMAECVSGLKHNLQEELPYHLFTLRAKDNHALRDLMIRYEKYLSSEPIGTIGDVCFTVNVGRAEFPHRVAIVTKSVAQLREQLKQLRTADTSSDVYVGEIAKEAPAKTVFLFSDEGTEYTNMGRQLYETLPAFRDAFDQCGKILASNLESPLSSVVYSQSKEVHLFQDPVYAHLALFALEYSLVQVWKKWGVEAEVVMGHGVGEYAAACVAGVWTLEEALKLTMERGRLVKARGKDSSQFPARETRENLLLGQSRQEKVRSNTFSDQKECFQQFYHALMSVKLNVPKIQAMCFLTGKPLSAQWVDPGYWMRQEHNPVQGVEELGELYQGGPHVVIEIGPGSKLSKLPHNFSPPDPYRFWCSSLHSEYEDLHHMFRSLGALFVRGVKVDWRGIDQGYSRKRLRLPTYPFRRQRYWLADDQSEEDLVERKSHQTVGTRETIPVEPCTVLEELLIVVWQEVLQVERVGLHDDFFDMGGQSLLAVQLIARLRNVLELDIHLHILFDYPTIASFAVEIDKQLHMTFPNETQEPAG